MSGIFGYFDDAGQTAPVYDPGLAALCPFCLAGLEMPVVTTSLFLPGDDRSFFYRAHRNCEGGATAEQIGQVEGALIESRAEQAKG